MMRRPDGSNSQQRSEPISECAGCALGGRREFLRTSLGAMVAALVGVGVPFETAAALPVTFGEAVRRFGNELRYPLPAADGVTIDRDSEVILARSAGMLYAFNLSCPHQHTALKWLPADGRFQCPKHKSKYKPDGTFISGRATRGMDRFAVKREGTQVVVNLSHLIRQDKDAAGWSAAGVSLL